MSVPVRGHRTSGCSGAVAVSNALTRCLHKLSECPRIANMLAVNLHLPPGGDRQSFANLGALVLIWDTETNVHMSPVYVNCPKLAVFSLPSLPMISVEEPDPDLRPDIRPRHSTNSPLIQPLYTEKAVGLWSARKVVL